MEWMWELSETKETPLDINANRGILTLHLSWKSSILYNSIKPPFQIFSPYCIIIYSDSKLETTLKLALSLCGCVGIRIIQKHWTMIISSLKIYITNKHLPKRFPYFLHLLCLHAPSQFRWKWFHYCFNIFPPFMPLTQFLSL